MLSNRRLYTVFGSGVNIVDSLLLGSNMHSCGMCRLCDMPEDHISRKRKIISCNLASCLFLLPSNK